MITVKFPPSSLYFFSATLVSRSSHGSRLTQTCRIGTPALASGERSSMCGTFAFSSGFPFVRLESRSDLHQAERCVVLPSRWRIRRRQYAEAPKDTFQPAKAEGF